MGIGVAFDFFDFFFFFFLWRGGGSNFRLLGLENSSNVQNVITYPEGTKEVFKCCLYARANPTSLPFLTLIPA